MGIRDGERGRVALADTLGDAEGWSLECVVLLRGLPNERGVFSKVWQRLSRQKSHPSLYLKNKKTIVFFLESSIRLRHYLRRYQTRAFDAARIQWLGLGGGGRDQESFF